MKNDRFIYSGFWNGFYLQNAFGNDAKIPLMPKNKLMNIRARANSWRVLPFLKSTNGSSNFNANNNIINISILIFLHPRSSGTDPSSQGRKLNRIRLMSTTNTKFRQLLLHILADNTRLNAGHHIVLIHPLNTIHSSHIHRYNRSFLFLIAHKRLSDVSSSTKGNQHNVMLLCCFDEKLGLLVGGYVHYIVD